MRTSHKLLLIVGIVFPILVTVYVPSFARINHFAKNIGAAKTDAQNTAQAQNGSAQSPQATPDFSKNKWEIPADSDKTKNPIATSDESIAKGKEIYTSRKASCVFCHGDSGAGNTENLPKLRRKPADLSDSKRMPTLSDGEIYWKISKGITGIMPASDPKLTDEERWNLVNYVRTLAKTN